jgi:hypothetical protein
VNLGKVGCFFINYVVLGEDTVNWEKFTFLLMVRWLEALLVP